ncbi:hypothetical protein J2Z80_002816 [Thermoanaerobacterium butyriciformans]|uniref:Uncharacterized protein n=1 Tax=Thermoanaerobacterium butyriciformans TaxID=1702242 RepID=A0ABS4NJD0_9THEO|nr:hypothetical protein [Thermoanaerobacterium butyriciformans]
MFIILAYDIGEIRIAKVLKTCRKIFKLGTKFRARMCNTCINFIKLKTVLKITK